MKKTVFWANLIFASASVFGMTNMNENAPNYRSNSRHNLRNLERKSYVQPAGTGFSQFPETDNSQDGNYTPSQETPTKKKKLNLKLNKSPNRNSPTKTSACQFTDLNLIKDDSALQEYKTFPSVKRLKMTIDHLPRVTGVVFPKLEELHINRRKIGKKPKIAPQTEITDSQRQTTIDELWTPRSELPAAQNSSNETRLSEKSEQKSLQLHQFFWNNPNLETLHLGYFNLKNLPSNIWDLTQLKDLTLKKLKLSELPSEIGNLKNLEKLDLSNNKLTTLPETIGGLKNLTELTLVGNRDLAFPEIITKIPNLLVLNIDKKQKENWDEELQGDSLIYIKTFQKNIKITVR